MVVAIKEKSARNRIARLLEAKDVLLIPAPSLRKLVGSPEAQTCDVIVAAADEPGLDPRDALAATGALVDRPDVVFVSATDDASQEARLLTAGAMAVVSGSLPDRELADTLKSLLDRRRQLRAADVVPGSVPPVPEPRSPAMTELLRLADRVAVSDTSVLILGETGTGKEWLARRVHAKSRRAGGPFVAVSCAAIPEGLVESELFGHVKGAFTGAIRSKRGHFESADGGTLFLDEIGDIPPAMQVKLLRALQEHSFQPVGGERPIHVDVRIIAATNRGLSAAVKEGTFRQDLYYRLAVLTLNVPPLRDRTEDVPPLVEAYARHFAAQLGRPAPTVSDEAMEALARYAWPGNVRELINVVERAVLLAPSPTIGVSDLPTDVKESDRVPRAAGNGVTATSPFAKARDEAVAAFERRYLTALLTSTSGRIGEAARQAGISPRTLYSKMKTHRLRKEDFKG